MNKGRYTQSNTGFTLIEIIVSMAIFTVVSVVAVGAFLKIIDANNKSHTLRASITTMNYALEAMVRELRVGTNYYCVSGSSYVPTALSGSVETNQCSNTVSNSWTVAFNSSRVGVGCNLIFAYYFDGNSLFKMEQAVCLGDTSQFYPIISNDPKQDVVLTFITGSVKVVNAAGKQPYVQFRFKGTAGTSEKVKTAFELQTLVSQRLRQL